MGDKNQLEVEIEEIDAEYQAKMVKLYKEWDREINSTVDAWNAKSVYVKTDPRYNKPKLSEEDTKNEA